VDFTHTRVSWRRPLTSYDKVRRVIGSAVRNRSWLISKNQIHGKEYLDVGCGPNTHANFINLDYGWRPGIDICWDVTRGLPLESNSLKGLFTEHCFEHLPFDAIPDVLAECCRVIKPGGSVRIVVPDGELYLTQYTDIVRGQSSHGLPYAEGERQSGVYSPIVSVNRIFRDHGHLFIYDFDMFRQLLAKAGFVDIRKETYQQGRDPQLLLDSESRAVESLYIEASVPTSRALSVSAHQSN
jgi:predicted SAM-dependent methyltransferase